MCTVVRKLNGLPTWLSTSAKKKKKITVGRQSERVGNIETMEKTVQEIAGEYNDVKVDYMFVDNAAMQIIINPNTI